MATQKCNSAFLLSIDSVIQSHFISKKPQLYPVESRPSVATQKCNSAFLLSIDSIIRSHFIRKSHMRLFRSLANILRLSPNHQPSPLILLFPPFPSFSLFSLLFLCFPFPYRFLLVLAGLHPPIRLFLLFHKISIHFQFFSSAHRVSPLYLLGSLGFFSSLFSLHKYIYINNPTIFVTTYIERILS